MGKVKAYYLEEQQEQEQYYSDESETYYAKILKILAKCNLQDLRTIYESLFEIGFRSEK